MQPETFDSQNVDEIEAYFSRVWGSMRIGNVAGHTRARISRRALSDEVGFDDAEYTFDIGYAADPPGRLIISDVVHNTIRFDSQDGQDTFGPGDQFLVARPGLPYAGVALSTRLRLTIIDPAVLDRVAGPADGAAGPARLLDHRPISRLARQRLQRTIAYLRESVLTPDGTPTAPLVASTASQYLAATVLQTYPNTAVAEATAGDRHDAHPDTLRCAVAFIEANPHRDVSVADIAAACSVTVRAVQRAFRRHLDTTPMAYLRRVRLQYAHEQLRDADPTHGHTVTAIAAHWGFAHPSRFTAYYRQEFGRPPSQTLRT